MAAGRHCVTHRGLQQLCTSYSLEAREYFFDRSDNADNGDHDDEDDPDDLDDLDNLEHHLQVSEEF